MTMRKLPVGGVWTPLPINPSANSFNLAGGLSLVHSTQTKVMYTFYAPVSGTLDMFEFYWNEEANNGTTVKVSFQDLDSDDLPDGTPDQYRTITVGSFPDGWVEPGLMTSDGTDNGTKRTVTRGQKLGVVIELVSSTAGDIIYIGSLPLSEDTVRRGPGGAGVNDGSWVRQNMIGAAALRYEGTVYYPMPEFVPAKSLTAASFNSGTEPDEIGLEFAFQTPVRIGGASFCIYPSDTSIPFEVVVYDENSNVLETVSVKSYAGLAPNDSYSYWTVKFSQDIFVPANVSYRVTIKPTSASDISLMELYTNSAPANYLYGYLDTGSNQHNWMHVEITDGNLSEISTTDTIIPLISLNVTGTDMETGGGTDDWTGDP